MGNRPTLTFESQGQVICSTDSLNVQLQLLSQALKNNFSFKGAFIHDKNRKKKEGEGKGFQTRKLRKQCSVRQINRLQTVTAVSAKAKENAISLDS